MAMTHEDFAHICLKIKSGADILIPCCGNCEYYKELTFSDGESIWECHHPETTDIGDEYIEMTLAMAPEDFCSRFEEKKDKLPRSCGTCKYVHRKLAAEPCDSCDIHLGLSNWEARDGNIQ